MEKKMPFHLIQIGAGDRKSNELKIKSIYEIHIFKLTKVIYNIVGDIFQIYVLVYILFLYNTDIPLEW